MTIPDRRLDFVGDTVAISRRYYRPETANTSSTKWRSACGTSTSCSWIPAWAATVIRSVGQGKIDQHCRRAQRVDRREIFGGSGGECAVPFRYRKEESERPPKPGGGESAAPAGHPFRTGSPRRPPEGNRRRRRSNIWSLPSEKRTLEIGLWLNTLERSGHVLREHDDRSS